MSETIKPPSPIGAIQMPENDAFARAMALGARPEFDNSITPAWGAYVGISPALADKLERAERIISLDQIRSESARAQVREFFSNRINHQNNSEYVELILALADSQLQERNEIEQRKRESLYGQGS